MANNLERVFQGHRGAPCEGDIRIKTWKKGRKRHTQNCCCWVTKPCLTLRPHGLRHTRLLCPSSPCVCSNSSPLCQWWHATISSSVTPFSSSLQSFPALGSFPVSWFFASGGHSTGATASASVLPMNIQGWFPLELNGLVFLLCEGFSRVFSTTTVQKHQFLST